MKRNLAFLLAGILAVSPLSAGIVVSADTDVAVTAITTETETASTEEELKSGELAETTEMPAAESTAAAEADASLPSSDSIYTIASIEKHETDGEGAAAIVALDASRELKAGDVLQLTVVSSDLFSEDPALKEAAEKAQSTFAPADLVWECNHPDVVSLDEKGVLTVLKEGEADLFVSFTVQNETRTAELHVTIAKAAEVEAPAEAAGAETANAEQTAEAATAATAEAAATEEVAATEAATATEAAAATDTATATTDAAAATTETAAATTEATAATTETAAATTEATATTETAAATTDATTATADAAAATDAAATVTETETKALAIEEAVTVEEAAVLTAAQVESAEASLLAETGFGASMTTSGKWVQNGAAWYYVQADGKNAIGFVEIGGKNYYFAGDGSMKTSWVNDSGKWYFFNKDGSMATGWLQDAGKWYYLNPSDGVMAANTILTLNNTHYLMNASGAMMIRGWHLLNGVYYYADGYGRLQTGWKQIDGKWYYLDPKKNGACQTGLITIDKNSYVLDDSGAMQIRRFAKAGDSYYYVDGYGIVQKGWIKINNLWYYLDPNKNGARQTGLITIGSNSYYLDGNGVMQINKWVNTGGYYYYVNGYGIVQKGWNLVGSKWYYMEKDGKLKTSSWLQDNGHWYYLGSDGAMKRNEFAQVGSKKYHFDGWGFMQISSWISEGGKWYYVNEWGEMQTGTVTINGSSYEFNSDGSWIVSTASYNNRTEFIALMAQLVRKYAPQWGVKVYSPIIAQAILESAYGESSLGKKYNNFFGLKCGTLWKGKSVSLKTGEEYSPGSYTTITANFRVYDSIEEGVRGYFVFLFDGRTRYNNLIGVTDPRTYLQNIKNDGYATSSKYVDNCMNVVKKYNLTQYDY